MKENYNTLSLVEKINVENNHSANEWAEYIKAAKKAQKLFNNGSINNQIKMICDEILEDGVINSHDIPKIIELYAAIKGYFFNEAEDHMTLCSYLLITEIIILTVCTPLLGNITSNVIYKVLNWCTKFIIDATNITSGVSVWPCCS